MHLKGKVDDAMDSWIEKDSEGEEAGQRTENAEAA
jgi:hypothetical protein